MQRHLDRDRVRYLPAVPQETFQLSPGEPLGQGLKRLALDQFEQAIDMFTDPAAGPDQAVHTARKATKRVRAMLRLVRPEIGDKVYRYENRNLRDTARLLSGVRDAAVAVETVRFLGERFSGSLPIDVFDRMSERLDRRALHIRQRVLYESDAVPRVVGSLEKTRNRFAGWPTGKIEKKVYPTAVRDRYDAVGAGFGQTYRRGRTEMKRAYSTPTAVNFHQWRKRVKYLRYQTEMLQTMWPEVVGAAAFSLARLSDLLGAEHDLADLLALLTVDPQLCPDPVELSLFAALAQHRRTELQAAARVVGMRVYAEKPDAFVDRHGIYWESTRLTTPVGVVIPSF